MPGQTANIQLCMRNVATDLTCLEAEIQLPEGLSLVVDEAGEPVVTQIRNRTASHEILANALDNGNLKLLISSIDADMFAEGDGPLMSFCVQADVNATTGICTVETVGQSLLVNTAAEAYYSVGVTGNVLVTDDPTGITTTDYVQQTSDDKIYNLAGQRVSKAKNGIFIKNGKPFALSCGRCAVADRLRFLRPEASARIAVGLSPAQSWRSCIVPATCLA